MFAKVFFFLVLIFWSIPFETSAQMGNLLAVDNSVVRSIKYTEIKGSPYLFDDWKTGDLIDSVGNEIHDLQLRYNVYYDRIEVSIGQELHLLKPTSYHGFLIKYRDDNLKNQQLVFSNSYNTPGLNALGYFQELYKGSFLFLKKHIKLFTEVGSTIYGSPNDQKSFQSGDKYFIVFDHQFHEVKLNKRNMVDLFSSKSFDVENYLDIHNLKGKSESDWIAVLKAIDAQ